MLFFDVHASRHIYFCTNYGVSDAFALKSSTDGGNLDGLDGVSILER